MGREVSHCHRSPLEDYIWWVSTEHGDVHKKEKRQCNWWCAACGGQHDRRNPDRILVIRDSTGRREAKVFRTHDAPHGACDNLVKALKLLANQQPGGVAVPWGGGGGSSRKKQVKNYGGAATRWTNH